MNFLDFYDFIYERQKIWHDRFVLKKANPWTNDSVLQKYKFCNIYRRLDKGTKVITDYIYQTKISPEQKFFNIIGYRFFNRIETISTIFNGGLTLNFDEKKLIYQMDKVKEQGGRLFSDAYLVSSHPFDSSFRPKDKHVQVVKMLYFLKDKLSDFLHKIQEDKPQTVLKKVEDFIPMVGPFLSGQILLDMTYSINSFNNQDLVNFTDNDFLIVGPGAHWGVELLLEQKVSKKEADDFCRFLHKNQKKYFTELKEKHNKDWKTVSWKDKIYSNQPYLSLHDIQGSLCEFRKYTRLTRGEKAKKRYYKVLI